MIPKGVNLEYLNEVCHDLSRAVLGIELPSNLFLLTPTFGEIIHRVFKGSVNSDFKSTLKYLLRLPLILCKEFMIFRLAKYFFLFPLLLFFLLDLIFKVFHYFLIFD